MTIADKLVTIAEGVAKVDEYNKELEKVLSGQDTGGKGYYDEFWDEYQDYGNRTNYERAFAGAGWNDKTFKPKYKVNIVGSAYMTFAGTSLTEITRETVDFSKTNSFNYTFYYQNRLEKVEVDCSSALKLQDVFYNDTSYANKDKYGNLADVKLFNIKENCDFSRIFNTPFPKLTNLFVSGAIGNNLDLRNLTLISKDSITSVVNTLSPNASGKTLTLSNTAVNNAFTSEEWNALVSTKKNWTISRV